MSGEVASASVSLIIVMGLAVTGACGLLAFVALKVVATDREALPSERFADARAQSMPSVATPISESGAMPRVPAADRPAITSRRALERLPD